MHNTNQTNQNKYLTNFPYVVQLHRDNPDCTYTTVTLYSYMLAKWSWFNSKGKEYFESIEEISKGSCVAPTSVKAGIKWLKEHNLLTIGKKEGGLYFKNVYKVFDSYNIHKSMPKKTEIPKPSWIDDEEGVPF